MGFFRRLFGLPSLLLIGLSLSLAAGLLYTLATVQAWSEENLEYFDPLDYTALDQRQTTTDTVSSIHFDLVGALAIAAGFSVTDAATIQAYSQGTDAGPLPDANPVYDFDADPANYPVPPDISQVPPSPHCPDPTTISNTVTMGNYEASKDKMDCPGCFTDRFGPFGVFFHEPHSNTLELGRIHDWAFQSGTVLTGVVIYAYSSTVDGPFGGAANIYESTPCFYAEEARVDTGSIQAGSPAALGIYLHSLGDYWSHKECLEAADSENLLFAAHVLPKGKTDPLWPCRWTSHNVEFGDAAAYPDSNRTFTGTLAVYQALVDFAAQSDRPVYRSIPLHAENNHIYDTLEQFVHTSIFGNPEPRRQLADDLRNWALQTRTENPDYWLHSLYLPAVLSGE